MCSSVISISIQASCHHLSVQFSFRLSLAFYPPPNKRWICYRKGKMTTPLQTNLLMSPFCWCPSSLRIPIFQMGLRARLLPSGQIGCHTQCWKSAGRCRRLAQYVLNGIFIHAYKSPSHDHWVQLHKRDACSAHTICVHPLYMTHWAWLWMHRNSTQVPWLV